MVGIKNLGGFEPSSNEAQNIDWLLSAPWGLVLGLIVLAIAVLYLGQKRMPANLRGVVLHRRVRARNFDFDLEITKYEKLPISQIATAKAGPIHLEGTIDSASETLGATCVWRNQAAASPQSAVAAETVFLRDPSGKIALEKLDQARVIVEPDPRPSSHSENKRPNTHSLYLGDRVEVLGVFCPIDSKTLDEQKSSQSAENEVIYGTLGETKSMQIRLLHREQPASQAAQSATKPVSSSNSDPSQKPSNKDSEQAPPHDS